MGEMNVLSLFDGMSCGQIALKRAGIKVDRNGDLKKNQVKASCFTAGANSGGNHSQMDMIEYRNGDILRYSTTEVERLQTVPENYTNHVSNTQRYKMLGNGWTVDVITHILKGLL